MRKATAWVRFAGAVCAIGCLRAEAQPPAAASDLPIPIQRGRIPAIVTDTVAFLLSPPQVIASAQVTLVSPQPGGGRYCLVAREGITTPDKAPLPGNDRTGDFGLAVYDSSTGRTHPLIQQTAPGPDEAHTVLAGRVTQIAWLNGGDQALVTTLIRAVAVSDSAPPPPPLFGLHLVDAVQYTVRTLVTGPDLPRVFVSPTRSAAVVVLSPITPSGPPASSLRVFSGRQMSGPLDVGTPLAPNAPTGWSDDGTIAYFSAGSGGFSVDTQKSRVARLSALPASRPVATPPRDSLRLRLVQTRLTATQAQTEQVIHPLWLARAQTPTPYPLWVAADADRVFLAGERAVLYVSQGTLFVRPVQQISRAQFDAMQKAAFREQLLSDGFAIGVALQKYADANNGNYPANGADLRSALAPYLSDLNALGTPGGPMFTYSFAGGTLPANADAAKVVIGNLGGPGEGRAVLYGDLTTRWER